MGAGYETTCEKIDKCMKDSDYADDHNMWSCKCTEQYTCTSDYDYCPTCMRNPARGYCCEYKYQKDTRQKCNGGVAFCDDC